MAGCSGRSASLAALAAVVLGMLPATSAAAPRAIAGKLSKKGYTVIALAADGRARSVVARPGFKVRPPASRITLHLRDAKGRYAGPVVVGRAGKQVVVGVKAGAKLGRVRVRNGYATA